MNKTQFDILSKLAESKEVLTQRQIAENFSLSHQTVNDTYKELISEGLIKDGKITDSGLDALEPYRVKRAIFLASGFGSRLVPVTLNTPKPLVRVFGERIIDRLIDAVIEAGIEEIIIVRGYLAEQFDQLKLKYPNIILVDNSLYDKANNIASALQVADKFCNAYVFEADLLLYNPAIIKKYNYSSNFLGIPVKRSDDWCFTVKNGYIDEEKVGGTDCYQMVGISYWDGEDGKKLEKHIKEAFELPGGKELYWEQTALLIFKNEYKVYIRECSKDDIVEIDTFSELVAIDKAYSEYY